MGLHDLYSIRQSQDRKEVYQNLIEVTHMVTEWELKSGRLEQKARC